MRRIKNGPSDSCEKCFCEMLFYECHSVMCIRPFYRMVCTSLGCGNFGPVVEESHFLSIMRHHKQKEIDA